MTDVHDNLPATTSGDGYLEEPIPNPGLPEHHWRPTDVSKSAEKRAERQVAAMFALSMVCTVLFVVSYFVFKIGDDPTVVLGFGASNTALGVTLGLALLLIGMGIIQYARKLMADHEMVEMRHPAASSQEDREATLTALNDGLNESGIARRPLVRNTLLGAVGLVGIPAIVGLRDLGPLPGDKLYHTVWTKGMRVVRDVIGTPIHVSDLVIGDLLNAEPEKLFPTEANGYPELVGDELQVGKATSAVILHRMLPSDNHPVKSRANWAVDGIVCYSKICTHVGCPISLNEQTTHHLLCPCHQSTFDLADNGRVIFGPAARPLPQLPLAVDADGYLVAQSDFTEPIGPSFWERNNNYPGHA